MLGFTHFWLFLLLVFSSRRCRLKCQGWFIGWSRLSNRFIEVQFFRRRCKHPQNSQIRVSLKAAHVMHHPTAKHKFVFEVEFWKLSRGFFYVSKWLIKKGRSLWRLLRFSFLGKPQNWTRVDVSPPIHIDEKIFLLLLMVLVALVRYPEYEIIGLIGEELFAAAATTKNPNTRSKSIGMEYRDIWWWDDELSYWLIQFQLPLHYHEKVFCGPYLASI